MTYFINWNKDKYSFAINRDGNPVFANTIVASDFGVYKPVKKKDQSLVIQAGKVAVTEDSDKIADWLEHFEERDYLCLPIYYNPTNVSDYMLVVHKLEYLCNPNTEKLYPLNEWMYTLIPSLELEYILCGRNSYSPSMWAIFKSIFN